MILKPSCHQALWSVLPMLSLHATYSPIAPSSAPAPAKKKKKKSDGEEGEQTKKTAWECRELEIVYAPETVVKENLLPPLREGNLSILKVHKLSVSLNGTPVDPTRVDWGRVNIMAYTFSQQPGPENVLGKIKFMFPNKHTVYMHDTLAYRKKYFDKPMRAIGHECVRMEKPQNFAEALLAQDKGWSSSQVKDLWDNAVNKPVSIERKIPVHMVYFTAVVDDSGKISSFGDLYGLDNKMATALFGSAAGFPTPPPESRLSEEEAEAQGSAPTASSRQARTASSPNDIAGSLSFIDN